MDPYIAIKNQSDMIAVRVKANIFMCVKLDSNTRFDRKILVSTRIVYTEPKTFAIVADCSCAIFIALDHMLAPIEN
jgi:hypothetical protein